MIEIVSFAVGNTREIVIRFHGKERILAIVSNSNEFIEYKNSFSSNDIFKDLIIFCKDWNQNFDTERDFVITLSNAGYARVPDLCILWEVQLNTDTNKPINDDLLVIGVWLGNPQSKIISFTSPMLKPSEAANAFREQADGVSPAVMLAINNVNGMPKINKTWRMGEDY